MKNQEILMQRGDHLARECAIAGVLDNQLGTVLSHLKRHRNPRATAEMLEHLAKSVFATRSNKTGAQLAGLNRHVGSILKRSRDWEEAAQIVGWAKRLMAVHAAERKHNAWRTQGGWR